MNISCNRSMFQLRKDVNKTACKQNLFTSDKSSVMTARYLLEKLSLEKSSSQNIVLYFIIFTLPVSVVLII